MSRRQVLFNRYKQLRRDVRELKKVVKSKDTKIEQLQKQLEEKNTAKITHDEATIERGNYAAYEEELRRQFMKEINIIFAYLMLAVLGFTMLGLMAAISRVTDSLDRNNRSDPGH